MSSEQGWSSSSAIVASPAGLVWVRRRNGSWWPGRVVPRDQLPVKVTARSGTPIKLLGREDGSMDWYNLEKSKRVKPFRCGEYDECIEKVKGSASRLSKSASSKGKYVCRDEAILHALKLEKAFFSSGEKKYSGTGNSLVTTVSTQFKKKRRVHPLETQPGYRSNKCKISDETQELSQSVVSFERPNKLVGRNMQLIQKKRQGTPIDLEDDEGIKRMRDLQEIGSEMLSHRKHKMCVHSRWSQNPAVVDKAHIASNHGHGGNGIKSNRTSSSSMKNQPHVRVHEFVRRKDRRRALNKVCDGTRVIIPSYCHWDGSFARHSSLEGALDAKHESTSERTDSLDTTESTDPSGTSSDETVFNANENIYGVDDSDSETKASELSSMLEFIDGDCNNGLVNIPLVMDENIDGEYPNTGEHHVSGKFQHRSAGKQYNGRNRDGSISRYMEDLGENNFTCLGNQVDRARQRAQIKAIEKYSIAEKIHKHLKNTEKQVKRIGFDFLYEVEVTVQRNNHGSHAPLVSLMSKLDGKAIIGHPVPVEILEDGTSDTLLVRNDYQPARNIYRSSTNVGDMVTQKKNVALRYTKAQGLNYSCTTVSTSLKRKLSTNRKSGFLPRKIRRLSSFSADHKQEKKAVVEKMVGPIVACIPVRLVFSRITESLSCSTQARNGT